MNANVIDTFTMQPLGSFRGGIGSRWHFEISPDRQFLFTGALDRLCVRHFDSGKEEINSIETPWPNGLGANTVFAPGSRQLLIHSLRRAFLYDLAERRTLASFELPGAGSIFACFFDSKNRPKALAFSGSWEVWDLTSKQMEVTHCREIPESTNELGSPVISQGGAGKYVLVRFVP